MQTARGYRQEFSTIEAAIATNNAQYLRVVEKVRKGLGGSLEGRQIAVLGLSFKPNTDDVRESRALKICEALLAEGSSLRLFDPAAMVAARRVLTCDRAIYCSDAYEAVEGCDAAVVCTEWNAFRNLDLRRLRQAMRGEVLVDARNIFDIEKVRQAGFRYFAMGRA